MWKTIWPTKTTKRHTTCTQTLPKPKTDNRLKWVQKNQKKKKIRKQKKTICNLNTTQLTIQQEDKIGNTNIKTIQAQQQEHFWENINHITKNKRKPMGMHGIELHIRK